MKAFLLIVLQVILASGILYAYYHFFLKNNRFHQYNRYFLLLATAISIGIPFLRIPVYVNTSEIEPALVKTLGLFSPGNFEEEAIAAAVNTGPGWLTLKNILPIVYVVTAIIFLVRFCMAIIRIIHLVTIYPGEKLGKIRFIHTTDPATPFSFFRWLFWNTKIDINASHGQQILRHELFHIRQKHSRDVIFLEIITMIFWINPFFHLIKKEIKIIHEFLADKYAAEQSKEWEYAELLLTQALGTPTVQLTNPFFHTQIKRRIVMLTTSKKPAHQYLKKLMVLPLAVVTIGLFAFAYKNTANNSVIAADKEVIIVVDASHGGNDPGAKSPDNKYTESSLSLEIARQLQQLAGDYHVKVIMTRDDNEFPGGALTKEEALRKRVDITNKIKPAAFISIHLNSSSSGGEYTTKSGIEAYVSNKRNDDEGKQLASVILQNLSGLYKTTQELKYRSQAGIWVLDQSTCPSVLLECGFIDNTEDLAFITNKDNQEKIARKILEAIVNFRSKNFEMAMRNAGTDTTPSKLKWQPSGN